MLAFSNADIKTELSRNAARGLAHIVNSLAMDLMDALEAAELAGSTVVQAGPWPLGEVMKRRNGLGLSPPDARPDEWSRLVSCVGVIAQRLAASMALHWPLAFRFTRSVLGNRFVAHVDICGRVLAVPEFEGVWMHGVNPGAIAASGKSLEDANRAFGVTLGRVLVDIAEDAQTFEAFRAEVTRFFHETDEDAAAWDDAVRAIREGRTTRPEGLRRCEEPEVSIQVVRRKTEDVGPRDNAGADASELMIA